MRKVLKSLLALPLLAGLLLVQPGEPVYAGGVLTPHTAEYKIKISVLGGKLRTRLMETATGYRAESVIEPTGMSRIIARGAIRESSDFSRSVDGLRPDRFVSMDTIDRDGETVDFTFDWNLKEITGVINGTEFRSDLDGVVHDRVSLQYGVMHDLLNDIHRDNYSLQDAEKFKPLTITNIGSKLVKVPFGRFEAIGVQHQREGSSRVTTLWCVEELGYLPVIIEQHRKGKRTVRAILTEYNPI